MIYWCTIQSDVEIWVVVTKLKEADYQANFRPSSARNEGMCNVESFYEAHQGSRSLQKSQRTGGRSSQGPLSKGRHYHLPSSPPSTTAAQRGVLRSGQKYHRP